MLLSFLGQPQSVIVISDDGSEFDIPVIDVQITPQHTNTSTDSNITPITPNITLTLTESNATHITPASVTSQETTVTQDTLRNTHTRQHTHQHLAN